MQLVYFAKTSFIKCALKQQIEQIDIGVYTLDELFKKRRRYL